MTLTDRVDTLTERLNDSIAKTVKLVDMVRVTGNYDLRINAITAQITNILASLDGIYSSLALLADNLSATAGTGIPKYGIASTSNLGLVMLKSVSISLNSSGTSYISAFDIIHTVHTDVSKTLTYYIRKDSGSWTSSTNPKSAYITLGCLDVGTNNVEAKVNDGTNDSEIAIISLTVTDPSSTCA